MCRSAAVRAWVQAQAPELLYLSRITLAGALFLREGRLRVLPWRRVMDAEHIDVSILYTTVTLFAAMAVVVLSLFAVIIWWVVRKGRREQDG